MSDKIDKDKREFMQAAAAAAAATTTAATTIGTAKADSFKEEASRYVPPGQWWHHLDTEWWEFPATTQKKWKFGVTRTSCLMPRASRSVCMSTPAPRHSPSKSIGTVSSLRKLTRQQSSKACNRLRPRTATRSAAVGRYCTNGGFLATCAPVLSGGLQHREGWSESRAGSRLHSPGCQSKITNRLHARDLNMDGVQRLGRRQLLRKAWWGSRHSDRG